MLLVTHFLHIKSYLIVLRRECKGRSLASKRMQGQPSRLALSWSKNCQSGGTSKGEWSLWLQIASFYTGILILIFRIRDAPGLSLRRVGFFQFYLAWRSSLRWVRVGCSTWHDTYTANAMRNVARATAVESGVILEQCRFSRAACMLWKSAGQHLMFCHFGFGHGVWPSLTQRLQSTRRQYTLYPSVTL